MSKTVVHSPEAHLAHITEEAQAKAVKAKKEATKGSKTETENPNGSNDLGGGRRGPSSTAA